MPNEISPDYEEVRVNILNRARNPNMDSVLSENPK